MRRKQSLKLDKLRNRLVDFSSNRVSLARLEGSDQSTDLAIPVNCQGYGRIRHFRMNKENDWTVDPLPNIPAARALNIPTEEVLLAQVFQIAGCNWRCWYCFVDNKLLSADSKFSKFFSADEIIQMYINLDQRPLVIDLSGGQPDLVPEWALWMMKALESNFLSNKVFLWSDDNLSSRNLWYCLTTYEREYMAAFPNFARVGCFKGYDKESFSFNTLADPELFDEQFRIYKDLLKLGFDMYAYATLTSIPKKNLNSLISNFVDRLQEIHPNLPLRTVPLKIEVYSPTLKRMDNTHQAALKYQYEVHQAWREELDRRYEENLRLSPICDIQMKL